MQKKTEMKIYSKSNTSKVLSILLCLILTVSMAFGLAGCTNNDTQTGEGSQQSATQSVDDMDKPVELYAGVIGEGDTQFIFIVADADGIETEFEVHTDQTTVGAALLENGLIAGDQGEFGLYVKEVNGIVADYDKDQTYWAFYIDGEYATSGVDITEITEGSTYMFKVEK